MLVGVTGFDLWPLPCEGSAASTRRLTHPRPALHRRSSTALAGQGHMILRVASRGIVSGKPLATRRENGGVRERRVSWVVDHGGSYWATIRGQT